METGYMSLSSEETIQLLLKTNKEQEETIQDLRTTVKELRATIANLNETLEELKRKIFGTSSERTCAQSDINTGSEDQLPSDVTTEETGTTVKEHTRKRKNKSVRADLYEALPVKEIICDVPEAERFCPDCDSVMEHLGYKFVREELRITPAKVVRVRYMQETLVIPSSFCLVLPGCSTAMVIPHMGESKTLFWYVVWLIAGESFMKPFQKSGEKS